MIISEKLKKKILDFVASSYPEAGLITFDTLKRPPGPRMFVCVYDENLQLIKEMETSEVIEWVSQGTSETKEEDQITEQGEVLSEETKTEVTVPIQPKQKSGRRQKKKG